MIKALALGGGGAKGSYEIGVWQYLKEIDWQADIIAGVSVGALNGAIIAQDDYETAAELWRNIEINKVIRLEAGDSPAEAGQLLKKAESYLKSVSAYRMGLNTEPLAALIAENINEEKIRQKGRKFGLITNLWEPPKLTPLELFLQDIPQGQLNDYLMASAALFPALQSKIIDGKAYVDGGYYDNVPINMCLKNGADCVLAVDLDAIGFTKEFKTEPGQEVKIIKPFRNLGNVLNFNAAAAAKNMKYGYLDALKAFNKAKGCYFTFENQAFTQCSPTEQKALAKVKTAFNTETQNSVRGKAGENIGKNLEKKYRHSLTMQNDLYHICAEAAGEVFDLEATKLYSETAFRRDLAEKVQKQILQDKIYDNFGFSKSQSLKKKLRSIDSPHRALTLYKRLGEREEEVNSLLDDASILMFPLEFLTAVFLRGAEIRI